MWVGSRRGKSWRVVASRGESWRIVVARWIVRDRGESRGGSWRNVGAEIMGDRRGSWGTADCVGGVLWQLAPVEFAQCARHVLLNVCTDQCRRHILDKKDSLRSPS